eukprot:TRINITY_DN829_c0_g1_i4.p1 TRINITY_DN829_c0_g1~~TRINITY_DN829_c0_g1_i4.p1  ORF type:complete len:469 (+),score=68.74 TRINITY_DN829_c0_g1_i4:175-1407(+)
MTVALLLLLSVLLAFAFSEPGPFLTGRSTFYGNEWWLWDIHQGSCGYGYLCPEEGTGWDIAALPDSHWDYAGSCGRCYEVKCNPSNFQDNYGETLYRGGVCRDPEASVMMTVTDTCPCNYPTNFYSNMRWCCGDMDHLDISVWAFEKLAEMRWGVIGVQYREVPCDYKPDKVAPEPEVPFGPTPVIEGTQCPKGNFPLKENWELIHMMYRKRLEDAGMPSFTNAPPLSQDEYYARLAGKSSPKPLAHDVFADWFQPGWNVYTQHASYFEAEGYGLDGSKAVCSDIYPNGMVQIIGPQGSLENQVSMEMWIKSDYGIPNLSLNIGGPDGFCSPVSLPSLYYGESKDGYNKYDVYLGTFALGGYDIQSRIIAGMQRFGGCGYVHGSRVNTVLLQNNGPSMQQICMDGIKFMG